MFTKEVLLLAVITIFALRGLTQEAIRFNVVVSGIRPKGLEDTLFAGE